MDESSNRLAALERRLGAIEAVESIKQMKYRYWRACDQKDPEGMRACFVRNGAVMDYGPLGSFDDADPIIQIYREIAMKPGPGGFLVRDMHHGLMPDIRLISDTEATGVWTLRFRQVNTDEGTDILSAGEYADRYVIEDGDWKHIRCAFQPLWSITRPLDPSVEVAQVFPEVGQVLAEEAR